MISRRYFVFAGAIAAFVVAVDQLTKAEVRTNIEVGERIDAFGPLEWTHTHNDGVAFGIAGGGGAFIIVLSLVALVTLGVFLAHGPHRATVWVASGLILGGAAGNLIDRLRSGYVTDFILLPHWPAFNVADCAITVGVVVLAWSLISQAEG